MMKIAISLTNEDIIVLEDYLKTRSRVIQCGLDCVNKFDIVLQKIWNTISVPNSMKEKYDE
jgi:hypothetical protein